MDTVTRASGTASATLPLSINTKIEDNRDETVAQHTEGIHATSANDIEDASIDDVTSVDAAARRANSNRTIVYVFVGTVLACLIAIGVGLASNGKYPMVSNSVQTQEYLQTEANVEQDDNGYDNTRPFLIIRMMPNYFILEMIYFKMDFSRHCI